MRDLAARESLKKLAADASERFRGLLSAGEEMPFEVTGPDGETPFCQWTPLTCRFIRDHAGALSDLASFAAACSALASADLAASLLQGLEEPVPGERRSRAEAAVIAFLCHVWEGSSDFSLEGERLPATLRVLEASEEADDGEAEVVAPLIGFHMPAIRLELATATIIRADTVEVPAEVRRTEGTGRSAWEPQFLAVVRSPLLDEGDPDGAEASSPGPALRELVTTLRLFKSGGMGLGPYAWARTPGDRWRRLATGGGRPRPGGYRLGDADLAELADLSRAIPERSTVFGGAPSERPGPAGALARAVSRFEAGLERPALLEALSDYLLALRFLLEGGGASGVGLPMRVAALCAHPGERTAAKQSVERAIALERRMMEGELPGRAHDDHGPLEVAAELEEHTRAILRDAARGHLAADLRSAADEILLADGLASGEGAPQVRGAAAEWDAAEPEAADAEPPHPEPAKPAPVRRKPLVPLLQVIESRAGEESGGIGGSAEKSAASGLDREAEARLQPEAAMEVYVSEAPTQVLPDWMTEVGSTDTLDWPERPEALKLLDRRPAEREAVRERVRHLFPRPERVEWDVAELRYEARRTQVGA